MSNNPSDNSWDYLPFNDRDFTSVIELLNVPSCSPGLFTKQFGEAPPPINGLVFPTPMALSTPATPPGPGQVNTQIFKTPPTSATTGFQGATIPANANWPWFQNATVVVPPAPTARGFNVGSSPVRFNGNGAPHPFPYLNDEFFYSASNEILINPANGTPVAWWPEPSSVPTTPPYRSPSTANTAATPPFPGYYVGGPGGAGWHKVLDFFEVPSPAFGAIGSVASGANYDWARQDLRPGMLNLNLIIDEEVFLGLMGEFLYGEIGNAARGALNSNQLVTNIQTPSVVTLVDDNGSPLLAAGSAGPPVVPPTFTAYNMPNIGITDLYIAAGGLVDTPPNWGNFMKACFSDFLKIRHGGSGFIFGFGNGPTGASGLLDANGNTTPLASERPFRSLSYPDIDYTILRPAAPPPSAFTPNPSSVNTDVVTSFNFLTGTPFGFNGTPTYPNYPGYPNPTGFGTYPIPYLGSTPPNYAQDPGVKNPFLFTRVDPVQPPPIPARRLFQVPDYWGAQNVPPPNPLPAAPLNLIPPSNASSAYSYDTHTTATNATQSNATGDPAVNNQVLSPALALPAADLTAPILPGDAAATPPVPARNVYLGGGTAGSNQPPFDQSDHPYFRTEWLQRMANLTTVRTHQYAVWITVGFFEVTKVGEAALGNINPTLAYDLLGMELGALEGKTVRYRGFFLVDRTKLTGFNPFLPGDFRPAVVYRQLIE
jgi:hypothetical protein